LNEVGDAYGGLFLSALKMGSGDPLKEEGQGGGQGGGQKGGVGPPPHEGGRDGGFFFSFLGGVIIFIKIVKFSFLLNVPL
jgi:hypothetical protein